MCRIFTLSVEEHVHSHVQTPSWGACMDCLPFYVPLQAPRQRLHMAHWCPGNCLCTEATCLDMTEKIGEGVAVGLGRCTVWEVVNVDVECGEW